MHLVNVGIPRHEYEAMVTTRRFTPQSRERLLEATGGLRSRGLILYGGKETGEAVLEALGDSVRQTVDSAYLKDHELPDGPVVVATAPNHYQAVLENLERLGVNDTVLTLFAEDSLPVALIMETQPRSGTHYVIDNILNTTDLAYADIFGGRNLARSRDGLLGYTPGHKGEFVAKAHFTRPLHYPAYRYCKTAFLFSYFFDSYHSWGKLLAAEGREEPYVLRSGSGEWSVLRGYFAQHAQWLDYITDKFHLRYEDFYHDFEGAVSRLGGFAGLDLTGFRPPRPNPCRSYWADNYGERFDEEVFRGLAQVFRPWIKRYYPEKLSAVDRAL